MSDNRSEADLLREATLAQDACNLTGVVHAFSRAMTRLRELYPSKGTPFFNRHHVAVLYSSKIASLTSHDELFHEAYNAGINAFPTLEEWSKA